MSKHTEDGCIIDDGQVEWRDNSATAYCKNPDCEMFGAFIDPIGPGLRGALASAKLHTLATGCDTKVESQSIWVTDVSRATS